MDRDIDLRDYNITAAEFLAAIYNNTGGGLWSDIPSINLPPKSRKGASHAGLRNETRKASLEYVQDHVMTIEEAQGLINKAVERIGKDRAADGGVHFDVLQGRKVDFIMRISKNFPGSVFIDTLDFRERHKAWGTNFTSADAVIQFILKEKRGASFAGKTVSKLLNETGQEGADIER